MNDTLNALRELKEKHKDNLTDADVIGYIEDAISDLEYTLEKRAQDCVDQGLTQLPTPPYQTGRELGVTQ
jgi:vesicle coat complex subunit